MGKWLNLIFALLIIVFSWLGVSWATWINTILAILIILFSVWQPKSGPTSGSNV